TDGEIDAERRAAMTLALYGYVPAILLHDSVHRREPETCTFAGFLGREERFKHATLHARIDTDPCVGDREHDVICRMHVHAAQSIFLIEDDCFRLDGQCSAHWHCICRIHCEVHQNLLDLVRIGFDVWKVRLKLYGESDVLADQPFEQGR